MQIDDEFGDFRIVQCWPQRNRVELAQFIFKSTEPTKIKLINLDQGFLSFGVSKGCVRDF
jgi:hypothetical protein